MVFTGMRFLFSRYKKIILIVKREKTRFIVNMHIYVILVNYKLAYDGTIIYIFHIL